MTFCDMFDIYPVDSDIIARISYGEHFEPTPDDTVIVVPLAWFSVFDQALCTAKVNGDYVKFDSKSSKNLRFCVINRTKIRFHPNILPFKAKELPNLPNTSTTDQFYQLCYCWTANRTVIGVSTPFSFREVHEEELMEFQKEQNKEFWTFRSRFAVLMDIYWVGEK